MNSTVPHYPVTLRMLHFSRDHRAMDTYTLQLYYWTFIPTSVMGIICPLVYLQVLMAFLSLISMIITLNYINFLTLVCLLFVIT